jgi:hypothetical protein
MPRHPILPYNPQPLMFMVLVAMVLGVVIIAALGFYFISIWVGLVFGAAWGVLCLGSLGWVLRAKKLGGFLLALGVILALLGLYLAVTL